MNVQVCIPCLAWIGPSANCHQLTGTGDDVRMEWVSDPQVIVDQIKVATIDKWPVVNDSYGARLPLRAIAQVHGFPMCWRHAIDEYRTPSGRVGNR